MFWEIILAVISNFKVLAIPISTACVIFVVISIVVFTVSRECIKDANDKNDVAVRIVNIGKGFIKYSIIIFCVCIPVHLAPTVDDLWKARIGLVKLYIASPQNLEKGTEEISRIAKKLECKYLGGCEEEKKSVEK